MFFYQIKSRAESLNEAIRQTAMVTTIAQKRGYYTLANMGWATLAHLYIAKDLEPEFRLRTSDVLGQYPSNAYYDLVEIVVDGKGIAIPMPLLRPRIIPLLFKRGMLIAGPRRGGGVKEAKPSPRRSSATRWWLHRTLLKFTGSALGDVAGSWLVGYADTPTPEGWGFSR